MGNLYYNDIIDKYFDQIEKLLKEEEITYSGNYKHREDAVEDRADLKNTIERRDYIDNFNEFPLDTSLIQSTIEINHYFYEYSFFAIDTIEPQDIIFFYKYGIDDYLNEKQNRFLFSKIKEKYREITSTYPNNLGRISNLLKVDANDNEEVLIKYLIKHYKDLANSNHEQLNLFRAVMFTKEIADLFVKILIEFLTIRLNIINPDSEKYYSYEITNSEIKESIYELPENFKLTELDIKSESLGLRETAILFYYLRKYGATIDFTDNSLAKLVHNLTGHSYQNLRQKNGFGRIRDIEKEKREGVEAFNSIKVKELLQKIINDLDKNIKPKP